MLIDFTSGDPGKKICVNDVFFWMMFIAQWFAMSFIHPSIPSSFSIINALKFFNFTALPEDVNVPTQIKGSLLVGFRS